MKIFNLQNTIYTNYILSFDNGDLILVDCGYNFKYSKFIKKLKKFHLKKEDIKYVVLTHIHQDHLSYLQDLLDDVTPTVIVGEGAVENLKLGHDKLLTYSSIANKKLTELTAKFRGGPASWTPICLDNYSFVEVKNEDKETLKEYGITLLPLAGHTKDSIGFYTNDICMVGDAVMNSVPAKNLLPLLIEDEKAFKTSYKKLIELNKNIYYVGHGKPFYQKDLIKNEPYVDSLTIV